MSLKNKFTITPLGCGASLSLFKKELTQKKKAALVAALCLPFTSAMAADAFTSPYVGASLGVFQGTTTATEYEGFWDYGEYSLTGGLDLSYAVQGGLQLPRRQ